MAINVQNIERFKFIAHKIIPLVYDDSLSYYEFLCKVMQKLNEVISSLDNQNEILKEFDKEILDWETSTDNKYNQFVSNINTQFEAFKHGEVAARTAFMNALIGSYNESTHYNVGQYVRYGDNVYKCTTATSGETWNPAHWTQVVYADDLSKRQSDYEASITGQQNEFESSMQAKWDGFFNQYLETLGVVQNTGTSTTEVMSQKAVTEAVETKADIRYTNNKFANALKGSKSGSAILIDDVSPVAHDMSVKISSDTVEDLTAVKVIRCGKNLLQYPYFETTKTLNGITITDNGDGSLDLNGTSIGQVNFYLSNNLQLKRGITYTLSVSGNYSFGGTASFYIYDSTYGSSAYINLNINNSTTFTPKTNINGTNCYFVIPSDRTISGTVKPQLEVGSAATDYEHYITSTEYTPNADGTVEGVSSLYPNTTLTTDTDGVLADCEYNGDINKAFAKLQQAIISLGGNI